MINIEEASTLLQQYALTHPIINTIETISLLPNERHLCLNRIIAEDIVSPINVPDFDNSAMDGYACNFNSIHFENPSNDNKTTTSTPIEIQGEVSAGDTITTVAPNTCVRIFTGAPIPQNANVVIPQEYCTISTIEDKRHIIINSPPNPSIGDHIRPKGLNFFKGDLVCTKGTRISITVLTLLASLGITEIRVFAQVKVAIVSTGDELKQVGQELAHTGEIYESNSVFLQEQCKKLACTVDVFHIKDEYDATLQSLTHTSQNYDLVICSGGVSVGEKDYIQKILLEQANIQFRKVSIKPGKPFTFVTYNTTPILCVPGNPLSVFVIYLFFVAPFIKTIQAETLSELPMYPVLSPIDYKENMRTQFVFSHISYPSLEVSPLEEQSSASLKNIFEANGLMIIPANTQIEQGDILNFLPFHAWL